MNFLDEDVFNNNVYLREFGNLFVEFSICVSKGDRSFKNLISYEDFSLLIKKMVEDLINSYAVKLNYSKKFSLVYKTMEGINLGGVSGLIPMTGVPILLVSDGGSSTICAFIECLMIFIIGENIINY